MVSVETVGSIFLKVFKLVSIFHLLCVTKKMCRRSWRKKMIVCQRLCEYSLSSTFQAILSWLMNTTPMTPIVWGREKKTHEQSTLNYTYVWLIIIIVSIQVINLVVLLMYRFGYVGEFLGVGGTWNLNEEKSADAEIIASGVFVGFFVYTGVQLVAYLFGTTQHKR